MNYIQRVNNVMKRSLNSLILIISGILLILISLGLILYNSIEDYQGNKVASSMLNQLKSEMPPSTLESYPIGTDFPYVEQDLFEEYTPIQDKEPTLSLDGKTYLGILYIPSLNIELPILNELNYDNLKLSPCKYSGMVSSGDLIIAGHNYKSHFGKINELNSGDTIIFTNTNGVIHNYEVIQTEIINGNDVTSMNSDSSSWDLTLFTCTLSGQSRITVRAISVDNNILN